MHKGRGPEPTASYDGYRCSVVTVGTNGTRPEDLNLRKFHILGRGQSRMTNVHFNALAEAKEGASASSLTGVLPDADPFHVVS